MLNAIRRSLDAAIVTVYVANLAIMIFLNNAVFPFCPLALSLLFALLAAGNNPFGCFLICSISFIPFLSAEKMLVGLCSGGFLCAFYGVFGKKKYFRFFSPLLLCASLAPYVLLAEEGEFLFRIISSAAICAFSLAFFPFAKGFKIKGFCAMEPIEGLSLCLLFVCSSYGFIKYFGINPYKAVAVAMCFFLSVLTKGRESCLFWVICGIPAALITKDAAYLLPFILFGFVAEVFACSKPIALTGVIIGVEFLSAYAFRVYENYTYLSAVWVCAPALAAAFVPEKLYEKLREKLFSDSEAPLSRAEINRMKSYLGTRLYEISGTYKEISDLFRTIDSAQNPFVYEDKILSEIHNVCKDCSFFKKCEGKGFPEKDILLRLISIAKNKGKLTAVDLPKKFTSNCNQTTSIVFAINKFVTKYAYDCEKTKAASDVRQIASVQAEGISLAVKALASSLSARLAPSKKAEKALKKHLLSAGVNVGEIMITGEGEKKEILIAALNNYSEKALLSQVNDYFSVEYQIKNRYTAGGDREILSLEPYSGYDCVFGVSCMNKTGEGFSGDTHSLTRISRNSFLLALSDGMGSGEKAKKISAASLSLIECFYRAGIPPETCLETVNELLSFPAEDTFAALDVGVINLSSLTCDFIKLGAPYGFILSKGVVKLIEGSSLPMGIVKDLRPSVCTEPLAAGDVIIFTSDGVTDAFGSATDFADYLSAMGEVNPQKISDSILREAFALYGNRADDDMTVVACKIFAG